MISGESELRYVLNYTRYQTAAKLFQTNHCHQLFYNPSNTPNQNAELERLGREQLQKWRDCEMYLDLIRSRHNWRRRERRNFGYRSASKTNWTAKEEKGDSRPITTMIYRVTETNRDSNSQLRKRLSRYYRTLHFDVWHALKLALTQGSRH